MRLVVHTLLETRCGKGHGKTANGHTFPAGGRGLLPGNEEGP